MNRRTFSQLLAMLLAWLHFPVKAETKWMPVPLNDGCFRCRDIKTGMRFTFVGIYGRGAQENLADKSGIVTQEIPIQGFDWKGQEITNGGNTKWLVRMNGDDADKLVCFDMIMEKSVRWERKA